MDKKKVFKIATATTVAASALVSVAPGALAASTTTASKAVTTAEKDASKLKDQYNAKKLAYKKIDTAAAVKSYKKAVAEVKKLKKGKTKTALENRLKSVKGIHVYAGNYNTALDLGAALATATKNVNDELKKADFDLAAAKKDQAALKTATTNFTKHVVKGTVYGEGAREQLNTKYYSPAKTAATAVSKKVKEVEAELSDVKKAKAAVEALELAVKALKDEASVTTAEGLVAPAKAALAKVDTASEKKNLTDRIAAAEKAIADTKAELSDVKEAKAAVEALEMAVKALKDDATVKTADELVAPAKAALAKVDTDAVKKELTDRIAAAEKTIADKKAELAVPKVESVSAVNAKEVVVKFNKAVDEASVIGTDDLKAGVFKINNVEANTLTSSASLSEDGKTLTLVSGTAWNGSYTFELLANKAVTVDDKKVTEFKSFFTAEDTTRAEVTGVTYVDKFTYDIKFSEPVQSTGTLAYTYSDGTATSIVASATPSADKKSVRVVFNNATVVNKEITVSLPSITDFASNVSKPTSTKVTISDNDKTKPTVNSIKTTGYNGTNTSFQIKLSEAVKGSTVSGITVNGAAVTATVDSDDKSLINATVTGKVKGSALVFIPVSTFTDLNDNANTEVGQFYSFDQDEVAPTVVGQSIERINGVENLVLTFSENINTFTAPATLAFSTVDQYGMPATTTINTPAVSKHNLVEGQTKQLKISLAGLADDKSYKVTFAAGLVKDYFNNSTAEVKDVSFKTSTVNTGVGFDNVASVGLTPATPGKVTVSFTKPVNVASAQNIANYSVEDATVTKAEVTSNNSSGATVELTLADDSVKTTGNYDVTVKPITPFNSLDIANALTKASVTLKENVRPVLSSKVLTNLVSDALNVKLTFNDTTVVNGLENDFELYVNGSATGKKMNVASLTPAVEGALQVSWSETLPANDVVDLLTATSIKLVPVDTLDIKDGNGNLVRLSDIIIK